MATTKTFTWWRVADKLPPENLLVKTKIDDEDGKRNEQNLRRKGNLWWDAYGKFYMHYTPTHWTEGAIDSPDENFIPIRDESVGGF